MELKIKALSPKIGHEIPAPRFATAGSAAMDLCACIDEPVTLAPGERQRIPHGIAIALPSADYVALVFARSALLYTSLWSGKRTPKASSLGPMRGFTRPKLM